MAARVAGVERPLLQRSSPVVGSYPAIVDGRLFMPKALMVGWLCLPMFDQDVRLSGGARAWNFATSRAIFSGSRFLTYNNDVPPSLSTTTSPEAKPDSRKGASASAAGSWSNPWSQVTMMSVSLPGATDAEAQAALSNGECFRTIFADAG